MYFIFLLIGIGIGIVISAMYNYAKTGKGTITYKQEGDEMPKFIIKFAGDPFSKNKILLTVIRDNTQE